MTNAEVWWLLGSIAAVYYVTSCALWPYGRCLFCRGQARRSAWWGGGFRMCGWCAGTGMRLRVGRWIFNKLLQIRKAGQ